MSRAIKVLIFCLIVPNKTYHCDGSGRCSGLGAQPWIYMQEHLHGSSIPDCWCLDPLASSANPGFPGCVWCGAGAGLYGRTSKFSGPEERTGPSWEPCNSRKDTRILNPHNSCNVNWLLRTSPSTDPYVFFLMVQGQSLFIISFHFRGLLGLFNTIVAMGVRKRQLSHGLTTLQPLPLT